MADQPDEVDIIVGRNIKTFRTYRGLSQTALGEQLGITFQQVQKYERAANRVSASKLFHISRVLGVDVSILFQGTPQFPHPEPSFDMSVQAVDLAQRYDRIGSPSIRKAMRSLMVAVSQESDGPRAGNS